MHEPKTSAIMIRKKFSGWRPVATKIAVFIAALFVLRLAFSSKNHKPSSTTSYPSVPPDIEIRPGAISMMVVGDSISQGGEGDWTWRYRLWEWFKVQDVVVDFVGPFLGTRPQAIAKDAGEVTIPVPKGLPPCGSAITTAGYNNEIDSEFNPRHFSAVGRALWQDIDLISPMVARYNPDYLLVLLGFNDLAWLLGWHEATIHGDPLLANMEIFIARARAAKPDIKFVIGNVPQRAPLAGDLFLMTSDYNRLLAEAIPKWSTETSPIELADLGASYRCETDDCPSTFDGLHPSPLGEYQIARAFSRALIKGLKIGNDELTVPDPADVPTRPTSIPTNIKVMVGTKGVNITWDLVYGAKGYIVQSRVLGEHDWTLWPSQAGNLFQAPWKAPTIVDMQFRVRMNYGNQGMGQWSHVIETCRPWSSLTREERWGWRWWYRKFWACS